MWRCEPDALRQIWNHLLKDFVSTADELRNITVEENKCRWEAYGLGGSVGHGLAAAARGDLGLGRAAGGRRAGSMGLVLLPGLQCPGRLDKQALAN